MKSNPKIDQYIASGCGRCSLYDTPMCKVHSWTNELVQLRAIIIESGLEEELKWSQPCYTYQGKNVLILTAFKNYATLAFFKGSLLKDPHKILITPGANSQAVRQIRFTSEKEVMDVKPIILEYIEEAIELEKKGSKVDFKQTVADIPLEFHAKLTEMPGLKAAFDGLSPGRQRGYLIYFAQAKQRKTREARIEKYVERIMDGKGLNDR